MNTIIEAKRLMEDSLIYTDSGFFLDALDRLDKIIKDLQFNESIQAKIMISRAQTMLGFNLALLALKLQEQNKNLSSREIDKIWKSAFSCFGTAIAYQTAIGDTDHKAISLLLDTVFRLKMEKLNPEKKIDKIHVRKLGEWISRRKNKTDSIIIQQAQQFFSEIQENYKKDPFDIMELLDPEW